MSSNPKVAKVDKTTGVVNPVAKGSAKITAVAHNGIKATLSVKVNDKFDAPVLTRLNSKPGNLADSTVSNSIYWKSVKGASYTILRKTSDTSYKAIKTVKATDSEAYFTDKTAKLGTNYTYTVKRVLKAKTYTAEGLYDNKGITTLPPVKNLKIDATNMNTYVSWNKVEGADGYAVCRKVKKTGKYRDIAVTNETSFDDVFSKTIETQAEKNYFMAEIWIDPSIFPMVYQIRAEKTTKDANGNEKLSCSYYNKDGMFRLEAPAIVSFGKDSETKGTLRFTMIRNADGYNIYKGRNIDGKMEWEQIDRTGILTGTTVYHQVPYDKDWPYYSVEAFSNRNGKEIVSDRDLGFHVDNLNYTNTKILYLGDSLVYGSPYKGETTRHIFSYPSRVAQLTGVKFFNPSIPGATYSYVDGQKTSYYRYRVVTDVAKAIYDRKDTGNIEALGIVPDHDSYEAYDVVVMCSGGNDYGDNDPFIDEDENFDNTEIRNLTGACNTIMGYIEEASLKRMNEGKKPIKVVFVDFFYSDRGADLHVRSDRFTTPNKLGYTLKDYQAHYDKLIDHYRDIYEREGSEKADGRLSIYQFHTNDYDIVDHESCPYVMSDNIHMTRYGYTQVGNFFTDFLLENNIIEPDEAE